MTEWLTISEVVDSARANLPEDLWDYATGGAETETTLRRNRTAFDQIAFRPRILRGVHGRETGTTFLGQAIALPVMLAPVGSLHHYDPEGALAVARAADAAGTITWVSSVSGPALAEIRAVTRCPLVFQLYIRGGRDWLEAMVRYGENAGCDAICLTADVARYGRRERDLHNRFGGRAGRSMPNLLPYSNDGPLLGDEWQAALTWDDLAFIRSATRLPVILKGVMAAEDARLAVDQGVDAIVVSNHGGRQLDHAPATIEVLPEIVEAVAGRAEVIVDGGFMRGTDVLKAIALGAGSVLIGKLMVYGLAAGSVAGLTRTLEILQAEISTTMANLGVRTLGELNGAFLRPATAPDRDPWPIGLVKRET